ncbi:50S ribosome-binding GTPase [Bacillus sp. FJAT-49732]|uniref:50S ribosome-binding GTPase n=1 Tax=Lederbergia citrisecunda TaxID=2833583 RepID=A0A942YNP0_9BACI|nr:GTPase [Lederbergia citrisecunda]MBS4201920.1 50S ribosome-binding GTPase [Lederbergia citrisecunda]
MNKDNQFDSVFNQLKGQLNKLPIAGNSKKKMLSKLSELKEMTVDAREPRIALIGRRGAGKSSLINALFGEAKQFVSPVQAGTGRGKWFWYPSEEEKKIRLLDSRGLGETEKPIESSEEASAFNQLKKELEAEQPDVLLFLIKGKETDARIEEDLRELNLLRTFVKETHQYDVPVLCVVTQVDELDPPYYKEVPFDANPIKAANIRAAVELMEKRFQEAEIPLLNIIPVCTYVDFDEEGNILFDMRWNIDKVSSYLIDSLPNEAILKTAKATQAKSAKKKVAQKIILTMSGIAGIIALEPIPFADMPILTALQALMIMAIAYIAGREISRKTAAEFIGAVGANLGLAFAVREGVRSVVKLIPAAGNVISGAVAGAITFGIGQAGIVYFIDGHDIGKAKKAFQSGRKQYKKD